jgi:hypothetical protein
MFLLPLGLTLREDEAAEKERPEDKRRIRKFFLLPLGLTLREDEAADKERPEDKRRSRETSDVIPCPPQGQAQSDCQLLIAASSIV